MSDGERTGLTMSYNIRLLVDCPDHRGLIATVSIFIALHNGNILTRRRACQRCTQRHLLH